MIFGREVEKAILERLFQSKRAEFLAMYGRWRIGKTYLIYEYFKNKGIFFEITGNRKASKKTQLKRFYKKFSSKFQIDDIEEPVDWADAFDLIRDVAQKIDPSVKFIFFLDELPWLASPKSGFLSALDQAWNNDLSRMPNVLLIVCGSAAAWIIKKIVKDKDGLHGRLSAKIRLQPFTLSESERFLESEGVTLKRKQLIELYMAIGGVAKYLINVPAGKSTVQIINELCFSPHGFLFSEFIDLYRSLFDESEKHIAIVQALAKKRTGMSLEELLKATKIPHGGRTTEILEELTESGFIFQIPAFGKEKKERMIRLMDEYTFFYLSWIDQVRPTIFSSSSEIDHWSKMCKSPKWHEWSGHAFENICLKHVARIKAALGIAGVLTAESHWRYSDHEKGAEVDLIIDRSDDCIHLCEIKFCNDEFVIDRDYAEKLEKKKRIFQQVTNTRKAVFLTMITPYGVKKNEHYIGLVDQQLTMDHLF